ncbi:low molecular weight protein-tyrosine-phosphatase [Paenibacillus sp. YPG26]|uniref:low molecular weight protein-tyrosine-phosphatase n=1 Tax=Paenibacillus sp. YPG26 TaxID=2878915 RepID=UPI00203CD362|nr:low molecular weight protein-tyrosine-phosphatase [Paenibacillus sp. YPG26]USB32924.1 low molecular weight phosphotyrosine protein phosphatase [Paenibacillus sp. YPG26]
MVKVLFVCLGNICRSPMAEAMFKHLVKQEGLEGQFQIDSAGTGDWHIGNPPHQGTLDILKKYQVSSEGLFARQITPEDMEQFDYIIAMDDSNIQNMYKISGKQEGRNTFRLLDFKQELQVKDVPDPYFTGDFQETYDLLTEGLEALLAHIKQEQAIS